MATYGSILCIFVTIWVLTCALPTDIKCPEGEKLDANGKCVKVITFKPKPTLSPEQKAKIREIKMARRQTKHEMRKKLDDEIKEIKRLVFEGLEKGKVDLKCPDGKEVNEQGLCTEVVPGDAVTDDKKLKKQKRLEKKLERELEKVLKREIKNEMKAKRKNIKKMKKAQKKNGVQDSPKSDLLPICDENASGDATDCRPKV